MSPLISAKELNLLLSGSSPPLVLDATWVPPAVSGSATYDVYLQKHLPFARRFDPGRFADPRILPSELPVIHPGQSIVFYDNSPIRSACRAYWLFRMWGFSRDSLHVLDGGLPAFETQGYPLHHGDEPPGEMETPQIQFQSDLFRTVDQMKANLVSKEAAVIDMRHPVRFAAGHIPGSICFPYFACLDASGIFMPLARISRRLYELGIDLKAPIITSCGSGNSATVMNVVLDALGHANHALYNGSFGEWSRLQCPSETCVDED